MGVIATDSREVILNAAEQIITQAGYAGLSMRELSKQSGLAKSTLYHYFDDKHQIYLSVLERDLAQAADELTRAAAVEGTPLFRLTNVIKTYMVSLDDRGAIAFNALRRAGELEDQLTELFQRYRSQMIRPVADVVQAGIDDGSFRPVHVEQSVLSIFSIMHGFLAQRLLFDCEMSEVGMGEIGIIDHTLDLILNGLGRRSEIDELSFDL